MLSGLDAKLLLNLMLSHFLLQQHCIVDAVLWVRPARATGADQSGQSVLSEKDDLSYHIELYSLLSVMEK